MIQEFRSAHISWFMFQNYYSHSCRDIRLTNTGRAGRVKLPETSNHICTSRKKLRSLRSLFTSLSLESKQWYCMNIYFNHDIFNTRPWSQQNIYSRAAFQSKQWLYQQYLRRQRKQYLGIVFFVCFDPWIDPFVQATTKHFVFNSCMCFVLLPRLMRCILFLYLNVCVVYCFYT